MPVHWKIDSDTRLMSVKAEGLVAREEFEAMLDAMEGADAVGYVKLFDGRGADTAMDLAELMAIGVRIKALHARQAPRPVGALAIVIDGDKSKAETTYMSEFVANALIEAGFDVYAKILIGSIR